MVKLFYVVIALILFVFFVGWKPIWLYSTADTLQVEVTRTDRECGNIGDKCRYIVYTPDEVFSNEDSFWYFKFNSSDVNNQITSNTGKKINIKVTGIRFPFFSWYRNIIAVYN